MSLPQSLLLQATKYRTAILLFLGFLAIWGVVHLSVGLEPHRALHSPRNHAIFQNQPPLRDLLQQDVVWIDTEHRGFRPAHALLLSVGRKLLELADVYLPWLSMALYLTVMPLLLAAAYVVPQLLGRSPQVSLFAPLVLASIPSLMLLQMEYSASFASTVGFALVFLLLLSARTLRTDPLWTGLAVGFSLALYAALTPYPQEVLALMVLAIIWLDERTRWFAALNFLIFGGLWLLFARSTSIWQQELSQIATELNVVGFALWASLLFLGIAAARRKSDRANAEAIIAVIFLLVANRFLIGQSFGAILPLRPQDLFLLALLVPLALPQTWGSWPPLVWGGRLAAFALILIFHLNLKEVVLIYESVREPMRELRSEMVGSARGEELSRYLTQTYPAASVRIKSGAALAPEAQSFTGKSFGTIKAMRRALMRSNPGLEQSKIEPLVKELLQASEPWTPGEHPQLVGQMHLPLAVQEASLKLKEASFASREELQAQVGKEAARIGPVPAAPLADLDFPGNSLYSQVLPPGSLEQCRSSCRADPNCAGFTYETIIEDGQSRCNLKQNITKKSPKPGCVSEQNPFFLAAMAAHPWLSLSDEKRLACAGQCNLLAFSTRSSGVFEGVESILSRVEGTEVTHDFDRLSEVSCRPVVAFEVLSQTFKPDLDAPALNEKAKPVFLFRSGEAGRWVSRNGLSPHGTKPRWALDLATVFRHLPPSTPILTAPLEDWLSSLGIKDTKQAQQLARVWPDRPLPPRWYQNKELSKRVVSAYSDYLVEYDQQDVPGFDFARLKVENAAQCQEACRSNSKCVAYTVEQLEDNLSQCNLKRDGPQFGANDCCRSGIYVGRQIKQRLRFKPDLKEALHTVSTKIYGRSEEILEQVESHLSEPLSNRQKILLLEAIKPAIYYWGNRIHPDHLPPKVRDLLQGIQLVPAPLGEDGLPLQGLDVLMDYAVTDEGLRLDQERLDLLKQFVDPAERGRIEKVKGAYFASRNHLKEWLRQNLKDAYSPALSGAVEKIRLDPVGWETAHLLNPFMFEQSRFVLELSGETKTFPTVARLYEELTNRYGAVSAAERLLVTGLISKQLALAERLPERDWQNQEVDLLGLPTKVRVWIGAPDRSCHSTSADTEP